MIATKDVAADNSTAIARRTLWSWLIGLTLAFITLEAMNHSGSRSTEWIGTLPLESLLGWWPRIEVIYPAAFLVPLLLTRLRWQPTWLRRSAFGMGLQLLASIAAPDSFVPCLQVASVQFFSRLMGRLYGRVWKFGLLVVTLIVIGDTLLSGRHDLLGVASGVLLGFVTHRIAFAGSLEFLDASDPIRTVRFQLGELRNLVVRSRQDFWEAAYSAGHWDFLHTLDQRPRHYVISSIIRDRFSQSASVLDIGCGEALLYECLRGGVSFYVGLDYAAAAIEASRAAHGTDAQCLFERAAFEEYRTDRRFQAVVLSEILYYFPVSRTVTLCRRAAGFLSDESGIVIVSLCGNLKARMCARRLLRSASAEQMIRVKNVATGSSWTVLVFRRDVFVNENVDAGIRPAEIAPRGAIRRSSCP